MLLRPRQREFVQRCKDALHRKGNTLGIAPTGAGKTVMLSAVVGEMSGRSLILQHRDELVRQNRDTFRAINPGKETDLFTAQRKRWSPNATFAMVQTLSRKDNLDSMPPMDLVVIDEAHHVAARSYCDILNKALELNPNVKILGVTATPQRGDGRALRAAFDNVADVITLTELIASGFLVKPRFFVIDCDIRGDLAKVKVTANDFDMDAVSQIMDKQAVNERVIQEWKDKAGNRKTVIFCSTVSHARHVMEGFIAAGVSCDLIHGDMPPTDRRRVLNRFDSSAIQVLVNVAVLTEGWDCQDVSCVVLLRPCSYKGTMIQMIGRGLRKVDPARYPGVIKSDCIVLDFGYSLLTHGSIESDPTVGQDREPGEARTKTCEGCGAEIPTGVMICPMCGHDHTEEDSQGTPRKPLEEFVMTEIHLMDMSPFRWQDMFDGAVTMASGIDAWACLVDHDGIWYALGGRAGTSANLLHQSPDKLQALASADDFMRQHGNKDAAKKTKRWLHEPASQAQLLRLNLANGIVFGMTKYLACCLITWKINEPRIQRLILSQCSRT
jgi:superfamily II DNA or RNA helicase